MKPSNLLRLIANVPMHLCDEVAQNEAELEAWKRPIVCHWCLQEPSKENYLTHWRVCEKGPAKKEYERLEIILAEVTKLAKEPIVSIAGGTDEHDDALLRLVRIIEVLEEGNDATK